MEAVAIKGIKRTETGKKATKAIRNAGLVPCVIYGGKEVVHFSADEFGFRDVLYTPDFKLVEIDIDGEKRKCIIKDMQFHPVTDGLLHLDFIELVPDQKVIVEIPVRFKGNAPGVKVGGKIIQLVRRVKVKTTPKHIVDAVYVDISDLDLGQATRVRNIEVPEGMEIMNNESIPVATIEIPRALRAAAAAADKEE